MTLAELVAGIESQGYKLRGDVSTLGEARVLAAPLTLIPREPPVESDCQMIPNVLAWDRFKAAGWPAIAGYVRIEGAAALTTAAIVHLQFVKKGRAI